MIKEYKVKCANGYKIMVESYNSAQEVVNDCKKRKITDGRFSNMEDGNLGGHGAGWCGVKSYDEALELLKNGYQPTVEKLKAEIKATLQGTGKRISFKNDIVGYAPIVPLAIMGVPTAMINSTMKRIKAKVVDVYYDNATTCSTSSDDIIKYGAKVLAAIVELEQQGYRFNVHKIHSFCGDTADFMVVKIKDALQPIDLKRMSFPMTHTAFDRVISFDWYSKCPKTTYRIGYGHPLEHENSHSARDKTQEITKELFGENAVFVGVQNLIEKGDKADEYLREVFKNVKSYKD